MTMSQSQESTLAKELAHKLMLATERDFSDTMMVLDTLVSLVIIMLSKQSTDPVVFNAIHSTHVAHVKQRFELFAKHKAEVSA